MLQLNRILQPSEAVEACPIANATPRCISRRACFREHAAVQMLLHLYGSLHVGDWPSAAVHAVQPGSGDQAA